VSQNPSNGIAPITISSPSLRWPGGTAFFEVLPPPRGLQKGGLELEQGQQNHARGETGGMLKPKTRTGQKGAHQALGTGRQGEGAGPHKTELSKKRPAGLQGGGEKGKAHINEKDHKKNHPPGKDRNLHNDS